MNDPAARGPSALEVQERLSADLATLLKRPRIELTGDLTFDNLGVDSLMGLQLIGLLEEWLGCEVDATLIYDHPTIAAFSSALAGQMLELSCANGETAQ